MDIGIANVPLTLQTMGAALRDIQIYGVLESMVQAPWFVREVKLESPHDQVYALVRVFALKPLSDNPFISSGSDPADLYYTKGRILVTLTSADWRNCNGKWVTVGGDRPKSGLSIQHMINSDKDSPYNIGGLVFRKRNGEWVVRPNSITPYLYLPTDPNNPDQIHPEIHVGFDFPGHGYLQAFDGLDTAKGQRARPVVLPSPPSMSAPVLPEASPASKAPATQGIPTPVRTSPLSYVYSDEVAPPSDTIPSTLIVRDVPAITPDNESYQDTMSELSSAIKEAEQDFSEKIPELPQLDPDVIKEFSEFFYEAVKSVTVPQQFWAKFISYVKDNKVYRKKEMRYFRQDSASSDPYTVLSSDMGITYASRLLISHVCGYSIPIGDREFSNFLSDPWTFEARSANPSYESAYLGTSLLESSTLKPASKIFHTPNSFASIALALHRGYYQSDVHSTQVPLDKYKYPSSPELTDLHTGMRSPGVQPNFNSLEGIPGIISLVDDTFLPLAAFKTENSMFDKIVSAASDSTGVTDDTIEEVLKSFQESRGFELSDEQKQGVRLVKNRVGVLSGCAGSGKTTTSDCMTAILEASGYEVIFAAPTGKAAKRLSEVVGRPVRTIHSLFRIPVGSVPPLNPKAPSLEAPVQISHRSAIIFDEMAMCDTSLLAKAVNMSLGSSPTVAVFFLGDIKQLPPIGKGMPFRDFMQFVPTVELGVSRRAAAGSLINYNCNVLNTCSPLVLPDSPTATVYNFRSNDDFRLLNCTNEQISPVIVTYCRRLIELGTFAPQDIQVVTPYVNKSDRRNWDSKTLNPLLQGVLNPSGTPLFVHGGVAYREGDRLIHSRNNAKTPRLVYSDSDKRYIIIDSPSEPGKPYSGIVNGEVGVLHEVLSGTDPSLDGLDFDRDVVLMKVDDPDVDNNFVYIPYEGSLRSPLPDNPNVPQFQSTDLWDVSLAYAITVHKSQGSQYPCVIFPIGDNDYSGFVNRNMIYTAISRAQKSVAMVGSLNSPSEGLGRLRLSAEDGSDVSTVIRTLTEDILEQTSAS